MKLYRKRTLSEKKAMWWYSLEMDRDGTWLLFSYLHQNQLKEYIGNYPTRKEAEAAREAHWQASPVPGLEEVELCLTCQGVGELEHEISVPSGHIGIITEDCPECQGSGVVPVEEKP